MQSCGLEDSHKDHMHTYCTVRQKKKKVYAEYIKCAIKNRAVYASVSVIHIQTDGIFMNADISILFFILSEWTRFRSSSSTNWDGDTL